MDPKFNKGDVIMSKRMKKVGKVKAIGLGDSGYAFCIRFDGENEDVYYYDNGRSLVKVNK